MLTDLRNTGMEAEDGGVGTSSLSGGPTILVNKWGTLPYLVRHGMAHVELGAGALPAADGAPSPPEWRCWALSQGGRRLAEVPVPRTADGCLALDLDTAAVPDTATMFWELAR